MNSLIKKIASKISDGNKKALEKAKKIEEILNRKYKVKAFLSGSLAFGLNIPRNYDFDFILPARSIAHYEKIIERLSKDFKESTYNIKGSDQTTFKGRILGEEVDMVVTVGPKGEYKRYRGEQVKKYLSPEQKERVVKGKQKVKSSWFFPETRYWRYKKNIDYTLGLPRTARGPIDPDILCKGNKRCRERVKKHLESLKGKAGLTEDIKRAIWKHVDEYA